MRVKSATANGQRLQPRSAECLYCGQIFRPRRRGHVFCSNFCRYRGSAATGESDRWRSEGGSRVREDDWVPGDPDHEWRPLYAHETVGDRRRWYMNLLMDGQL